MLLLNSFYCSFQSRQDHAPLFHQARCSRVPRGARCPRSLCLVSPGVAAAYGETRAAPRLVSRKGVVSPGATTAAALVSLGQLVEGYLLRAPPECGMRCVRFSRSSPGRLGEAAGRARGCSAGGGEHHQAFYVGPKCECKVNVTMNSVRFFLLIFLVYYARVREYEYGCTSKSMIITV